MSVLTLGQRILEIRGNTSRKDFAKEMECGTTTLQRYENDSRSPDIDFLLKLQQKTGWSLDYLVHGRENNLNNDEALVIEKYRKSNESTRNKVLLTLIGGEIPPKASINNSIVNSTNTNISNSFNQSGFTELPYLIATTICGLMSWGLGTMANIKAMTDTLMSMAFGIPAVVLWMITLVLAVFGHYASKRQYENVSRADTSEKQEIAP